LLKLPMDGSFSVALWRDTLMFHNIVSR